MKIFIYLFILFSLVGKVSASDKIVFGIEPWKPASELYEIHKPLLLELEKKLNKKVEFYVSKDYKDLITQAKNKKLDIISFSTNQYVKAKEEIPSLNYLATVNKYDKNGKITDHYNSVILGLKSKGINTLKDLKNKNFAFTSFQSTSGYIYPSMMLKKNNIDQQSYFRQVFMLKKHYKVLDALLKGKIDGGATGMPMVESFIQEHGDNVVNILMKSDPIPFDAYVSAPHVKKDLSNEIQIILLNYKANKEITSRHAPIGFTNQTDAYYDIVREANRVIETK